MGRPPDIEGGPARHRPPEAATAKSQARWHTTPTDRLAVQPRRGIVTGREYRRTRVRGYAAWTPQPAALDLLGKVRGIVEEYAQPLTLRQVFYRLVGAHGYPKTEAASDKLGNYVNRARRSGLLAWNAIRDDDNVVPPEPGWDGTGQFWDAVEGMAEDYIRTPRGRTYVEVWVEAAGMVPQIESVADPFGVRVIASGGFSSVTARRYAALRLFRMTQEVEAKEKVALLVGDLDPSGASIMDSSAEDVLAFSHGEGPTFARLAVTPEQAEEHALESAPQKPTDKRGEYMAETYQAEALDPADLAEIVRTALSEVIPARVLKQARSRGKAERAELLEIIEEVRER